MQPWLTVLCSVFVLYASTCASGCQRLPSEEDDDDGTTPSSTTDGGTFLPGDSNDDDDVADGDSGGSSVCDPVAQTGCSPGEKCTAIVSGGMVVYACVADPAQLDPQDPCQPSVADGLDGCPAGYACIRDEAGNGLCTSLCEDDFDCTEAVCLESREDEIPYCADDCSPFESSCPSPLACRRNGNRFSCQFIGESDTGSAGAACAIDEDAGCAPGFVCLPGALIPECTTDNCCTSLCDVTDIEPCASPSTCLEILQGPAPGFEDIGACFVPA